MATIPATLEECEQGIVVLDTEYCYGAGLRHDPVCLAWCEYPEGEIQVARREEVLGWTALPFMRGPETVLVSFNAGAEAAFLLNLTVPQPFLWFDVMVEDTMLRNVTVNRTRLRAFAERHKELYKPGRTISLLEAAQLYGIEAMEPEEKDEGRELVKSRAWERGGEGVWQRIETYCMGDVEITRRLFDKLAPQTRMRQALMRGAFAAEVGRMGQRGLPADGVLYQRLRDGYRDLLGQYRQTWDGGGVRLTPKGGIRAAWWEQKLEALGQLDWYPRTKTGKPSTKLADIARLAREREDDAELTELEGWLRLKKLFPERRDGGGLRGPALGPDGRFRYDVFAFGTHTGRSLGSSNEAVLQLPAWFRGLVTPAQGEVLGYLDYAAQEVAIAGALSQDQALLQAYAEGDVYIEIARMAGAITADTSEEEIRRIRRVYKVLVLGRNYGMSFKSFWRQSGLTHAGAARAWTFFQRRFARLDLWRQRAVGQARKRGMIQTSFGWRAKVFHDTKTTTLMNWPVQSAGADVLRTAVLRAAAEGYDVLAVAYDSLLVSVPEQGAEARLEALREIMAEAAELTVGVRIRVGCQVVKPGERFLAEDDLEEWGRVMKALEAVRGICTPDRWGMHEYVPHKIIQGDI